MNLQEAERLSEYIQEGGKEVVEVLGIEPLGSPGRSWCMNGYFVKCAYKCNGLPFVVKSYEQWESRKIPPEWLYCSSFVLWTFSCLWLGRVS